jgi:hypothetical protein
VIGGSEIEYALRTHTSERSQRHDLITAHLQHVSVVRQSVSRRGEQRDEVGVASRVLVLLL